jgi:PleD family two-component response regulator
MGLMTTQANNHYSYANLGEGNSFSHNNDNNSDHHYYCHSDSSSRSSQIQESISSTFTETGIRKESSPFLKRIIVIDDEPDVTLTFKVGLEGYYVIYDQRKFEVNTYNNPILALTQFRPHFYDLLLTDIYMPDMNVFAKNTEIIYQY